MTIRDLLLVATGGAFGAMARYCISIFCSEMLGDRFPWGTLFVNVLGCFLMGWLFHTATISVAISDAARLAVGTGFLGALTTFSTFGMQTILAGQRAPWLAIANVTANVLLGLLATMLGIWIAHRSIPID